MKAVDLAKVAAAAEGLRIKKQALRIGRQIAFLVLAAVFGFFALVGFHVVLWTICYGPWDFGRVGASLGVFGFDLVIALVLVLLGRSRAPSMAEVEARITRDRTISELKSAVALTAVASTVTGPAGRFAARSAWGLVRNMLPKRRRG